MNSASASSPDAEAQRQHSLLQAKLHEVAAETGYAKETIEWVFTIVVSPANAPQPAEGTRRGLSAEALCEKLIRRANDLCPGELRVVLETNQLYRSEDIGEIVTGLVEKGLLVREEDDYLTDFDGLFETEHLGVYLAQHGIRRRWLDWPRVQRRLSLALYAVGIAVVIASYLDPINVPYGWMGWAIGMSGWVLTLLPNREPAKGSKGHFS